MVYSLSYQLYECERGLGAAERRAADVRAGEAAAALRNLRRALRPWRRVRSARQAADAATASARVLTSVR
jgi:hypothetical protein